MKRPCSEPGCPLLARKPATRCASHRRESPTYLTRTNPERERRARTVAAWRAEHGNWCPGYGDHAPHPSDDLTAAHIAGAQLDPYGPLTVLCRSINSSLANQPVKPELIRGNITSDA